MKLSLELRLLNVFGGDGFTRIEKIPETKLKRSKRRTITRKDIGVPVESDVEELRTELVERDVQTFKCDGEKNYYLRLGGPHGKLWGALKAAAEILKDSTGEFQSYAEVNRAMRAVNIMPVWVKLENVKPTVVENLPQLLAGSRSSMIVQRFDVIPECEAKVEIVFPDHMEKKIQAMLKQLETMGCLNKRRSTIGHCYLSDCFRKFPSLLLFG